MKVLHIVSGDISAGAARGSYWLHKGIRKLGVDSNLLTNSFDTLNDPNVFTIADSKKNKVIVSIREQLDNFPSWLYRQRKKHIFSTGFFGKDFTKTKVYQKTDIVHLHWINAGLTNIKLLSKIRKPIVWTMRDMWPMTGGCHYSITCTSYKTGCGKCPQLKSRFSYDLSKIVIERKKKYFPKNIKIVGVSNWLSKCAIESSLFNSYDIRTIFNNVDCHEFSPIPKKAAIEILGLPHNKRIVLVGAQNLNNFYKGFDKYIQSIEFLKNEQIHYLFFGKLDSKIILNLDLDFTYLGFLHDNISLRLAYSAADVFVAPSIMDAFPKTLAESMACGTPVVCFDATGPKDIVDHRKTGYTAKPFDSQDLAEGIKWMLKDDNRLRQLSIAARKKVEKNFNLPVIARQYQTLYKEIINEFSL